MVPMTHDPSVSQAAGIPTLAVHAGREDLAAAGTHVPPIDLSSTYPVSQLTAGGLAYDGLAGGEVPGPGTDLIYQRLWNPTIHRFERALAALEGAEESVAFASGMAAMTAVLLACVTAGTPHVVAIRPLYGGTDHLLATGLLGTRVTWAHPDQVAAAIEPDTGVVILETPANPTLRLLDIAAVVGQAGDIPVLVDNTFATPILQRPTRQGATLVLHSATKYLGGHGDLLGGVVAGPHGWAVRLRQVRALTGAVLYPQAGYLLHRGLQTLAVRVTAAQATAQRIAQWLAADRRVERVSYPGLPGGDPLGLIGRQQDGPGAMIAFEVAGGYASAAAVTSQVRLITHAVSLGGVDSLIEHPVSLTHRPMTGSARPPEGLLRLSVGLESAEDLIADLDRSLGR